LLSIEKSVENKSTSLHNSATIGIGNNGIGKDFLGKCAWLLFEVSDFCW